MFTYRAAAEMYVYLDVMVVCGGIFVRRGASRHDCESVGGGGVVEVEGGVGSGREVCAVPASG